MKTKDKKLNLEDGKIYYMHDLINYLRQIGLPCSRPTIRNYEATDIIPKPRRMKHYNKETRIYSAQEIKDISLKIYSAITNK